MTDCWQAPSPRGGMAGALDRFIGPGATKAELALQFVLSFLAAAAAPIYAARAAQGWSWLQYAVCAVLALDIAGGIITNSTSSAKRWYHREGRGIRHHMGFVCLHLFHLLIVSWLFLDFDFYWILISGGYLIGSAAVILSVPHYLQRPAGAAAYSTALLISILILRQPAGLEWFLPLFFFKLLICHLLKEGV